MPGTNHPATADLLDGLATFVRTYVVLSPAQVDATALWIAHTHAIEAAEVTPYLAIGSAVRESGKTLLLDVLAHLVARPLATANISEAALFRVIAERRPTLLFDEIDTIFGPRARDREDMRGLLNAGYRRGLSVYRCGGESRTTLEEYDVFCAKALAGIGTLPDTIHSRSIPIYMRRRARHEAVERFRRVEVEERSRSLFARVEAWAAANVDQLRDARPELPGELSDRTADVWEPLLAIADAAGDEWSKRARRAAKELAEEGARRDDSPAIRLLADIRSVYERRGADADRIASWDLVNDLRAIEDAPWDGWGSRGLTPQSLSRLLKPFDIGPTSLRIDGPTHNGYYRAMFTDAWDRHLPPLAPNTLDTPNTPRSDGGVDGVDDVDAVEGAVATTRRARF